MRAKRLTIQQRKEIFRDLVLAQDGGMPVTDSKQFVAQKHRITDAQLNQIMEEGEEKDWPPLDEPVQKVAG